MAMTVSYSVVPRKNPAKKDEPAKYYAQAQSAGELDFEELCEAITVVPPVRKRMCVPRFPVFFMRRSVR